MKTAVFCVVSALASADGAQGQSLDDYLAIAAESNPALRASFGNYLASLERLPQVSALPDPQVSVGLFLNPMERTTGNQVADISLMQMFPWFGTLKAAKSEAAAMAKANYESFREAKSEVFYEVKATWYALALLEREIAIAEENLGLLRTLEEIAINRFRSGGMDGGNAPMGGGGSRQQRPSGPSGSSGGMQGMGGMATKDRGAAGGTGGGAEMAGMQGTAAMNGGSMVDVLRVQLEINELENRLALLADDVRPLTARFNRLLNRPAGEAVGTPDSLRAAGLPVALSEMPDSIRRRNPMLAMLEREEEAFLAQAKMNRKMGFPMIGLGLQYTLFQKRAGVDPMMNGRDMVMPMATVSIPLWRRKYNASVREASLQGEAVAEQRRDAGNRLQVSYEEAARDFRDAERRAALFQRQKALAEQALNVLTVQYSTAGNAFEEVLRMQQQLLDYRLRELDALVDRNVAVAMLDRLMGR